MKIRLGHILVAVSVAPVFTGMAEGQETSSPAEDVVAVVEAFHRALSAADSIGALSLLTDEVVILENGQSENKDHYRSGHLAGDIRFAQAVRRERSEIRVEVVGEVAWAHSTDETRGQMGDRTIDSRGAELMVLVREEERWKIAAIHWSSR